MGAQRRAKIEGHIDKLYEEIRAKAVAAAAADYSGLPQPLFDLLTTLTEKLGPLIDLGEPMGIDRRADPQDPEPRHDLHLDRN